MRFDGNPPPYLMRFLKTVGRGINRYGMIGDSDRVLIAVSGGKDSLALALALALRRRYLPIHYDLEAVMIDWRQYPHGEEAIGAIGRFFAELSVPFTVIESDIAPDSFSGNFNCYLCGRNRRRILFEYVQGWEGRPLIATGHHLDDIVETTLINVCFRGSFSTMMPVQSFFDDRVRVIRPMCLVREEVVLSVAQKAELPVAQVPCPLRDKNVRARLKPILRQLHAINPQVRENINRAHANIERDYLPEL
jgi:tRNA 2-thiocytidine biosynthesis protein TtcA